MASPRIQVVIDATAEGLKKGAKAAGDSLDKLGGKLDGLGGDKATGFFSRLGGAAKDSARNGLGPLGDAASALGVDLEGMSATGLVAGAAVAAMGTAAVASVNAYLDLTERVRDFSLKAGVSAETASRLIANMDDLSISTDSGATAIQKLARNIDAGALDAYGIAVARTADGTVDMEGTLRNVADALAATSDPTKRATMGTDLLGKSYADILPLLNLGSKGMKEWSESVSDAQVVTAANIKDAQEFKNSLDNLKESASNVGLALGKEIVPVLTTTLDGLNKGIGALKEWDNWANKNDQFAQERGLKRVGLLFPQYVKDNRDAKQATDDLKDSTAELDNAQETAAAAAKAQAEAEALLAKDMRLATEAAARQQKVLEGLKKAGDDLIDTALSFDEAQMAAWESQQELTKAFDDLANGTGDYTARLVTAEKAVKPYIDKQWEIYRVQKELNGVHLDAGDKADFYNKKLGELITQTGDPNLRDRLMTLAQLIAGVADQTKGAAGQFRNLIDQISLVGLQDLLGSYAEIGAALPDPLQRIVDAANGVPRNATGNATGGNVSAGQPTMVGEAGPEMFVPQSNGRILTADDLARVGGGGGQGVTIVVNSPIGRPDDVVRWMREELRRLDRGQR